MAKEPAVETKVESGQEQAAGTENAASFDWNSPIPRTDDTPPIVGKYKTFSEFAKAASELQTALNKEREQSKASQKRLSELEAKTATTATENGEQTDAEEQVMAEAGLSAEEWADALSEYYKEGQLSEETLKSLHEKTRFAKQFILNTMETAKLTRERVFEAAKQAVEGVDMESLEAWLESGTSPFSPNAIAGFRELAGQGDVAWVKTTWDRYQEFIGAGGTFVDKRTGERFGVSRKPLKGVPVGTYEHPGFKTQKEYHAALKEAGGDPARREEVHKKLQQTPEKVIQSPVWKS